MLDCVRIECAAMSFCECEVSAMSRGWIEVADELFIHCTAEDAKEPRPSYFCAPHGADRGMQGQHVSGRVRSRTVDRLGSSCHRLRASRFGCPTAAVLFTSCASLLDGVCSGRLGCGAHDA